MKNENEMNENEGQYTSFVACYSNRPKAKTKASKNNEGIKEFRKTYKILLADATPSKSKHTLVMDEVDSNFPKFLLLPPCAITEGRQAGSSEGEQDENNAIDLTCLGEQLVARRPNCWRTPIIYQVPREY